MEDLFGALLTPVETAQSSNEITPTDAGAALQQTVKDERESSLMSKATQEEMESLRTTNAQQSDEMQRLKEMAAKTQERLDNMEREKQKLEKQLQAIEEKKSSVAAVLSLVNDEGEPMSPRRPLLELSGDLDADRVLFAQVQSELRSKEEEVIREQEVSAVLRDSETQFSHEMERKMRTMMIEKDAAHGAELRDTQAEMKAGRLQITEERDNALVELVDILAELASEKELVVLLRSSEGDLAQGTEAKLAEQETKHVQLEEAQQAELEAERLKSQEDSGVRQSEIRAKEQALEEARGLMVEQVERAKAEVVAREGEVVAKEGELRAGKRALAHLVREHNVEKGLQEEAFRAELQAERQRRGVELEDAAAAIRARDEAHAAEVRAKEEELKTERKRTKEALKAPEEAAGQAAARGQRWGGLADDSLSPVASSVATRRLAAAAAAGGAAKVDVPALLGQQAAGMLETRQQLRKRLGLPPATPAPQLAAK